MGYSPHFQKLLQSGRLVEHYDPKTDRFSARFRNISQIYGANATGPIVGHGTNMKAAINDLCDKYETALHFQQVLDRP